MEKWQEEVLEDPFNALDLGQAMVVDHCAGKIPAEALSNTYRLVSEAIWQRPRRRGNATCAFRPRLACAIAYNPSFAFDSCWPDRAIIL